MERNTAQKKWILLFVFLIGIVATSIQAYSRDHFAEDKINSKSERMTWWREARFGMFIHWGLYAIPAGEWKGVEYEWLGEWIMQQARIPSSEYELLKDQFNPVKFDANKIVRLAK
ncbi:MAG: alpha-L-fucosidase, partial [Candidatus Aminicenantaceae bacterium]